MERHVLDEFAVAVFETYQGLFVVPAELGDAVTLADVGDQVDEAGKCRGGHTVRRFFVARYLDGDGAVVVGCVARTPAAVGFIDIERDVAQVVDAVVTGCHAALGGEELAERTHVDVTCGAVDGDGVDLVVPGCSPVRAYLGVGY